MKRFSIEILVRVALVLVCTLLFLVIFILAKSQTNLPDDTTLPTQTEEHISTAEVATEATSCSYEIAEATPEITLINVPLLYPEVQYEQPITRKAAIDAVEQLEHYIQSIEFERYRNTYTEQAIGYMLAEVSRINEIKSCLLADIDRFLVWEAEYTYATRVWYFLRENGFSEEVSAGIIGNMMIETSGGTLALKPAIYSRTGNYYGLCQWSKKYHPEVIGKSFEEQLEYLSNSIISEFNTFGFCYRKDFTYDDFSNLRTPEEAAHAFAAVYERCDPAGYSRRKQAARVAYEYFTSEANFKFN